MNAGGIVVHVLETVKNSIELERLNCSSCVWSEKQSRLTKYDHKPSIPELFCSSQLLRNLGRGVSYIFHPKELVTSVWSDGPCMSQHLLQRRRLGNRLLLLRRIRIRPWTRRSLSRSQQTTLATSHTPPLVIGANAREKKG